MVYGVVVPANNSLYHHSRTKENRNLFSDLVQVFSPRFLHGSTIAHHDRTETETRAGKYRTQVSDNIRSTLHPLHMKNTQTLQNWEKRLIHKYVLLHKKIVKALISILNLQHYYCHHSRLFITDFFSNAMFTCFTSICLSTTPALSKLGSRGAGDYPS